MASNRWSAGLVAFLALIAANTEAAQCGSALLLEVGAPAVFDGVEPSAFFAARFWEAGSGGANRGEDGCLSGCMVASGAQCAGGGDCIALSGVNWINASCSVPGQLPLRTVFVVEQLSTDTGGRWAAINLDRDAADANTDLDTKAAVVCGGCVSVMSPYLGGTGRPTVVDSTVGGGALTLTLAWVHPPAAAQALSNGPTSSLATASTTGLMWGRRLPPRGTRRVGPESPILSSMARPTTDSRVTRAPLWNYPSLGYRRR